MTIVVAAAGVMPPLVTASAADREGSNTAISQDASQPQLDRPQNFYVRGDLGIGQLGLGSVSQAEIADNGGTFISQSIGDTAYIGVGVGLQFNRNIRADLTGEYRSTADIRAMDNLAGDLLLDDGTVDGSVQSNTLYQGNLSSYVGLLNGYVDLFNWRGVTPYIGAGIGFAQNRMSGLTTQSSSKFTDADTGEEKVSSSVGNASDHSQTSFAWALMAGASYDISSNAKLDLGYRYLNLGASAAMASGVIDCVCGAVGGPLKGSDLDSHEFRIGLRWELESINSQQRVPPVK